MRILFEYFIYRCCMQITNFNALKILFISNGIFVFADRLLGTLYAIFVEKFDTNILSVSFSWFIFMLSATLFTLIISKYADRIKEKEYLLIAGFILRVISWILYIFTNSLLMFIFVQILIGIGEAVGSPALDSILTNYLKKGAEINN